MNDPVRPLVSMGEVKQSDEACSSSIQLTPEEVLTNMTRQFIRNMVSSPSFIAIMEENFEEALAVVKTQLAERISETISDEIDCDDIATNAIQDSNIETHISNNAARILENAAENMY